jgi:hypothetical protein
MAQGAVEFKSQWVLGCCRQGFVGVEVNEENFLRGRASAEGVARAMTAETNIVLRWGDGIALTYVEGQGDERIGEIRGIVGLADDDGTS